MAFNYNAAKQAGFNDAQIGEYMRLKGVSAPQKKSVAGFAGNVVKSGARAVGDLGGAVVNTFNPDMKKNTVANLGRVGLGAAQMLIPGEQGLEKNARAVGSFYKDRYGSMDAIKNTLYNDPVGVGLDVASVATGVGGALKGAGSLSKVAGLTKAGNAFTKAAGFIDPFSLASKGAGAAGRATISNSGKVGQRLRGMAENLSTRGLGNPALQAKAASKAGQSTNDFMRKYDWYDRSSETMGAIKKNIQQQYDDKALRSSTSVPTGQIVKQIDAQINKLRQGVNGVVSDSDMKAIEELTRRRQQMLQAVGGQFKDGVQVSSPIRSKTRDLTRYRREVIDKDIPQSTYNLDAQASGTVQGTKTMRDFLRKTINSTDPQLERLGLDIGQAKSLGKVAEGYESRGANRQLFNFTKLGSAGIGGFLAGAPGIVGGFAAEQIVNHPTFLKYASKAMDSVSNQLSPSKNRLQKYYTPEQNLSPAMSAIQDRFYQSMYGNMDDFSRRYRAKYGNELNPDNIKEFSPEYAADRAAYSSAVHEPASAANKTIYDEMLQEKTGNKNTVFFTAGGAGSGKTTAIGGLDKLSKVKDNAKIVFDSTLSKFSSADANVTKALKSGHVVHITYVAVDPVEAFVRAVGRAKKAGASTGRSINIKHFIDSHLGAQDTLPKLMEKYANDDRVIIDIIDNTGAMGEQHFTTMDKLNDIVYDRHELERILHEKLEQFHQTGQIDDKLYNAFKGLEPVEDTRKLQVGDQRNQTKGTRKLTFSRAAGIPGKVAPPAFQFARYGRMNRQAEETP